MSRRRPAAPVVTMGFLGLLAALAVLAPWAAPHDPEAHDLSVALLPPALQPGGEWRFLLGTDQLGRDILSRIIYGTRVSLAVGAVAVVVAGGVGIFLGVVAGYLGGWWDEVIMRLADIQLAFPFILLVIAVAAVVGPGLMNVIVILGLTRWTIYGRTVRSEVLAIREREYVEATRALGVPAARVVLRHILPNALPPVIVIATFAFANNIVAEAALSFLGLGVQPPTPTWGGMLADGRKFLAVAWWVATMPGLALTLTMLAINIVGDWLRDLLDPRMTA